MTHPSPARDSAVAYASAGLSVLPIRRDGSKAPEGVLLPADESGVRSWSPLQARLPTEGELLLWYGRPDPPGVGVIGGAVSGNLECLDFDTQAGEIFPAWCDLIDSVSPGLLAKLCVVETPRQPPGYHVRYRCETAVPGNTKLAEDPALPGRERCLIETRGEGGYALAPGCPPECHETKGLYRHVAGPPLTGLARLTSGEREVLIRAARSFDRKPIPPPLVPPETNGAARPGDDFNGRATWPEVLGPHGWIAVRQLREKLLWRRPGKAIGYSATTGHCSSEKRGDLLYVFTHNAAPLEGDRAYSKFEAYAVLTHGGDFHAAARALSDKGYGEPLPRLIMPSRQPPPDRPNAENSADPMDQDATAADLVRVNATVRWVWQGWIPLGVLTIVASEPGVGKTRFCADLLRRINLGLPWPDGAAPSLPAGSRALWVAADNQHPELGTIPSAFGFPPDALYLNATRREPFGGTMLDTADDLKDFERRLARVKPALVFVDTCLNATDRTSHKPEDAKAFFTPLQQIAARQQIGLVCVTHLNAAGKPLGRRIEGQGRLVMMLERPDPEGQPLRRKLYVRKSFDLFPPALGVTMGASGNEYDTNPPEAPEGEGGGHRGGGNSPQQGAKLREAQEFLSEYLSASPQRVSITREAAEERGIDAKTLYRAMRALGVEETEVQGRKWWELRADSESI